MKVAAVVVTMVCGCSSGVSSELETGSGQQRLCNGVEEYCERPLNMVTFAGTHNSMSAKELGWLPPNHLFGITQQLNDGIRGLNLDTYLENGVPYLCHGYCELGSEPLVDGLTRLATFIGEHPRNVIIVTFEDYISAQDTYDSFVAVGLDSELYHHETGTDWPTLGTLVEQETRLVVFAANNGGLLTGLMSQWEHWLENNYAVQSIDDFECGISRGSIQTATLFNMNHFITNPIALQDFAEQANRQNSLRAHAEQCALEQGFIPNQVLVDFYSIGGVLALVDDLNRSHYE